MKRFKVEWMAAGFLAALLTGCGSVAFNGQNFDVGITPNPMTIDIDLDDDGGITYTNTSQVFTFASKAGALGVTIEGYDIEFYEASDNLSFPGDSVTRSSGSLNVYVPAGLTCVAPDPLLGCTINSEGAVAARGPVAQSPSSFLVPIDAALSLWRLVGVGGSVGAYAKVYFYGTDDLQRPFRTGPYQFSLIII